MSTPTITPQPIAELVRDAREARGWSQRELARQVDVSHTRIQQIEGGDSPSLGLMHHLQVRLDLDPEAVGRAIAAGSARWMQLLVTLRQRLTRPLVTLRPAPAI